MRQVSRRTLLKTVLEGGLARTQLRAARQPFRVGIVPAGASSPDRQIEQFWLNCAETGGLGFRYVEVNNTRARIAQQYAANAADFGNV